jgi:uncharacterized protein (TIGR00251 family)
VEAAHLLDIQRSAGGVRIRVRAKPRSSSSRIRGVKDGALEVAVAAPPVDGEANAELCAVVARFFRVSTSAVTVVRGTQGRNKLVDVRGLDLDAARAAIESISKTPT